MAESLANGTLQLRHRFPVAVPDWDTATPDRTFAYSEILSIDEEFVHNQLVNSIAVRGYLPAPGNIVIELDHRMEAGNQGRSVFFPGDTVHLLIYAGEFVASAEVASSWGTITLGETASFTHAQQLEFDNSSTASLERIATSLDTVVWIGATLGDLTLESDGQTVTAASSGVALATVTYTASAVACTLEIPSTLPTGVSAITEWPILISVTASDEVDSYDGDILVVRGSGDHPGEDISDGLLTTTAVKTSRGRAEIDAGESLHPTTITLSFCAGLHPGQLVEIVLANRSLRMQLTGITHQSAGVSGKIITTLEGVRHG